MAKRGKLQGFEIAGDLDRPRRIRKYKYLYLIVCEDENTEKVYFQGFESRIPKDTIFLEAVGTGLDPLGIVQRAIVERDRLENLCGRSVDIVWVVFDKDDAGLNASRIARFKGAFDLAALNLFKVAYSNEVFELWLLLHLVDVEPTRTLGRKEIYLLLEIEIRSRVGFESFVYKHGDASVLQVIAEIGDEQAAFERASRLIRVHGEKKDPIYCNPVTYVGELVIDLYNWINFCSYES